MGLKTAQNRREALGNKLWGSFYLYSEKSKGLPFNPIHKNKIDFGFLLV